ncbi:uncharacterized protein LOC119560265 [Drosophila subpulchrella]|uniref:uncharacterized protein LOC119560265 n=1 Tax=Drosophila subpulchrella TaxID=1486046 RepID=UPI0018A19F7A|nr:uncharacterized protein LOC119560265 [Drosophila subpulchrella]
MSGRRYVRPNKLQGNCVTCRNFHSALSNAIRNRWTCCNINLTFYGPGLGASGMRPQSNTGQELTLGRQLSSGPRMLEPPRDLAAASPEHSEIY